MRFLKPVFALLCLAILSSCITRDNPDNLQEKTAEATARLKRDTAAMAAGVREGWNRDKPLDLNAASKEQLSTLPGITDQTADRIIAARPYSTSRDLVSRHILSESQFGKISDRITAKKK
jgi:DNA uptake protein ComE-like DNA-binding protein